MSKQLVSDLTAHLGYWLRLVSNHVSHAFAQKLEAENVTVAEWVMMRSLYDHKAIAPSVTTPTTASVKCGTCRRDMGSVYRGSGRGEGAARPISQRDR